LWQTRFPLANNSGANHMPTKHNEKSFFDLAKEIEKGHPTIEATEFIDCLQQCLHKRETYNTYSLNHMVDDLNEWLGTIPAGPWVDFVEFDSNTKVCKVNYITHDVE
jgi:hypothetical protein